MFTICNERDILYPLRGLGGVHTVEMNLTRWPPVIWIFDRRLVLFLLFNRRGVCINSGTLN